MAIQRVGVVGFGQMGSGIAQICAQAGLDTLVREVDQSLVDKGFQRVDGSLARLVKSGRTTDEDAKAARGRLRGTTSLADFKDRDLIIENRLMVPYLLGAIRMLELGVATKEDIDNAVKLGLGYPMGPFELIDYTGVDINYHVAGVFFDEFKEAYMAPPPLLRRMFLAGRLGTKTGKGFYEYDEQGKRKP